MSGAIRDDHARRLGCEKGNGKQYLRRVEQRLDSRPTSGKPPIECWLGADQDLWGEHEHPDLTPPQVRLHEMGEEQVPPKDTNLSSSFAQDVLSPPPPAGDITSKFRWSKSPLDSLQERFKNYSIPGRDYTNCCVMTRVGSTVRSQIDATAQRDSDGSSKNPVSNPRPQPDRSDLAAIPDWSFVQRRGDIVDYPTSSYCPSLATGSTISSRNSSTRSARSARWERVEQTDKNMCPLPGCGREFKDLAAHIVTHQPERPEKCPVNTCEYHVKGFARAYDRVKHTMTHFKGTIVCGFCSPATRCSFNRCENFLQHLVGVHGVENTPLNKKEEPGRTTNARRFSLSPVGQLVANCTLCTEPFDAQAFYEHFRGCVLRWVTASCTTFEASHDEEDSLVSQTVLVSQGTSRNDSVVTPVDDVPSPYMLLSKQLDKFECREHYASQDVARVEVEEEKRTPSQESREMDELTASSRCLSLTSSDEETDWTEDSESPYSETDADDIRPMLSPVKRQLVESIMAEFYRVFNTMLRTHQGNGSAGTNGFYSESSGSSTYSSTTFVSRKRSLSGGSSPPNDNEDDPHKRRRPDSKTAGRKQPMPELRFACPYYKRNPIRHQTFTSCRDPGFNTVARLKEHLYRRHLLPIQCNRCCCTFSNEPTLREHQRDPHGCEIREQIPLEGFDKDQERKLKSKKRTLVYQSEEDKWKGVYKILFPDDNEAHMPSPYIEYQPCNPVQTGESGDIARFQEFSRLELPRLVRRTLEVAVEEESQPLEEKLKERFVDIVRQCQSQLIDMFQVMQGPTANTSELAPVLSSMVYPEPTQQNPCVEKSSVTAFQHFDGLVVTESDLIPIPAIQYQEDLNKFQNQQPKLEPDANELIQGSPDSGYDSGCPTGRTNDHLLRHQMPLSFIQSSGLSAMPNYVQNPYQYSMGFVGNDYTDLGGYYGLFENRGLVMNGAMSGPWAFTPGGGEGGGGRGTTQNGL